MNSKYKKDYFKGITTTLSKARHAAVKEIANRLCAVRDELTSDDDPWLQTWLFNKEIERCIIVKSFMSDSAVYEKVNETLPRKIKGQLFVLYVLAGYIEGKRNRMYEYPF